MNKTEVIYNAETGEEEVIITELTEEEVKKAENERIILENQERIAVLKNEIANTDYKIIKCYEYSLASLELPYDISILHIERQAMRDEINELESQISQLIDIAG